MITESRIRQLLTRYDSRGQVPVCMEEFKDDVNRFLYVSKILRRYSNSGHLNIRLLLNHIIILHNVFDNLATEVLIEYVDEDLHPQLFGVLSFFSRLPPEYMGQEDPELIALINEEIE